MGCDTPYPAMASHHRTTCSAGWPDGAGVEPNVARAHCDRDRSPAHGHLQCDPSGDAVSWAQIARGEHRFTVRSRVVHIPRGSVIKERRELVFVEERGRRVAGAGTAFGTYGEQRLT